jgi:hypothetical protein
MLPNPHSDVQAAQQKPVRSGARTQHGREIARSISARLAGLACSLE